MLELKCLLKPGNTKPPEKLLRCRSRESPMQENLGAVQGCRSISQQVRKCQLSLNKSQLGRNAKLKSWKTVLWVSRMHRDTLVGRKPNAVRKFVRVEITIDAKIDVSGRCWHYLSERKGSLTPSGYQMTA